VQHVAHREGALEPADALTALPRSLTSNEVAVRDAANAFAFACGPDQRRAARHQRLRLAAQRVVRAGMTLNGAAGQTAEQMRTALQYGNPRCPRSTPATSRSSRCSRRSIPCPDAGRNSIWYRQEFPFRQAFFDTTKVYFDATVRA